MWKIVNQSRLQYAIMPQPLQRGVVALLNGRRNNLRHDAGLQLRERDVVDLPVRNHADRCGQCLRRFQTPVMGSSNGYVSG